MTQRIYIASPEGGYGRNVVALGVLHALEEKGKTNIFRPIASPKEVVTQSLLASISRNEEPAQLRGVCPCTLNGDTDALRSDLVTKLHEAEKLMGGDQTLIIGSDATPVFDPHRFEFNCQITADAQASLFLAICTIPRDGEQLLQTVRSCTHTAQQTGAHVAGIFITGCDEKKLLMAQESLSDYPLPVWFIPKVLYPAQGEDTQEHEALEAFKAHVPSEEIFNALAQEHTQPLTPFAFQYNLLDKAKNNKKTIVLPEGEEDRIIKAADYLLARDIVDIILVGDKESILQRGEELKLSNLSKATFQSQDDEEVLEPMIERLCELRAKKGMTPEQAREQLKDASYFGTMLVVLGKADGLVSGSINSTANTVRPALQVIKTKPGSSSVSGAFLMCLKDRVVIFADCAINTNPNAEQLADIAIQSAQTARAFGIDPKVGMLSYSTLGSGKGPDVDLVEQATAIVKEKAPELDVVGSIQFDAAWSPTVARTKAKGNDIAGHVNVFVFPDLCAGNISYKAVQRTSGALAIGPVLQGLNKPVNDLSRGALVEDIINTVALTAVTA